ncbi:MAG: RluA family pseudouridine synthase [Kiritimatiellae bacterium]|nr:RluA family pseudouridine synthase [Kiritimatiellia bacterium]
MVGNNESHQRLDVWLRAKFPSLSRSRIQTLIKDGYILVDGWKVRPHLMTRAGMKVSVTIPRPETINLVPENLPLEVLYEDGDILVVNKPANLVVHPAAGHSHGTLVNALLHHCRDFQPIGGELRPGIVHRLDRDTSGVLVVAKNAEALNRLTHQFKAGSVYKEYLALVHGLPARHEDRIETLIGRSTTDRKKMSAHPARGRPAITRYRIEERLENFALLRVVIETGRTHQIRVHMAHIGHPVVGDRQYGRRRLAPDLACLAPRQMLHAHRIGFTHPRSGERMEVVAPIPEDMEKLLSLLRKRTFTLS